MTDTQKQTDCIPLNQALNSTDSTCACAHGVIIFTYIFTNEVAGSDSTGCRNIRLRVNFKVTSSSVIVVQWNLRIKDTLGAELLSSFRRLSFDGRFEPICNLQPPQDLIYLDSMSLTLTQKPNLLIFPRLSPLTSRPMIPILSYTNT